MRITLNITGRSILTVGMVVGIAAVAVLAYFAGRGDLFGGGTGPAVQTASVPQPGTLATPGAPPPQSYQPPGTPPQSYQQPVAPQGYQPPVAPPGEQQTASAEEGNTNNLPPTVEFDPAGDQFSVLRPTPVFVAPNQGAPQAYTVEAGRQVEVIAKSKDGAWAWVAADGDKPAYMLMSDLGPSR